VTISERRLALVVVAAGAAGCWYVGARARREAEQVHREVERLDAEVRRPARLRVYGTITRVVNEARV